MRRNPGGQRAMTEPFGPFSVSAQQVEQLGQSFTPFINRLLEAETAAAGLTGADLRITYRENRGDGGVDARLMRAQGTRWIPAGDSAWQFKAGDLHKAGAASEFEGATHARSVVENGGKYILVLGRALNDKLIEERRSGLIEKALELQMTVDDDTFTVMDANALARWIEEYPALAASPLLRGMSEIVLDFGRWALSNRHNTKWISSESRQRLRDRIGTLIAEKDSLDLRIEGQSGVGKTRAVLEALRDDAYRPLVVYVPDTDGLPANLLPRLIMQDRVSIVVVDNCGARKHEALAGLIPTDSQLKLITIGEPDPYRSQSGLVLLGPLEDSTVQEVLDANEPSLWVEARRVVIDACGGNVRLAILVARKIVQDPHISAGDLITRDIIEKFITAELPDGQLFLACSVLALFTRIGFEGERRNELDLVASTLGVSSVELRSAAQSLTEAGLLGVHGRYRSVEPYPLAVYLAQYAWGVFSEQIVDSLLPSLNNTMAERLLTRAAEIGDYKPAKNAIRQILSPSGPFSSLEIITQQGNSSLLTQMAIVAPEEASAHISSLVGNASDQQLRETNAIRRNLVWALEKLVWHRRTFTESADALLRLAQVETETFGNNATGTWTELFGLMLPGTAAHPDERAAYLSSVATSPAEDVRLLAVRGAARGLSLREFIVVSGEIQGGVVVEPRGTPASWEDVSQYQTAMIRLLRSLVDDPSPQVAEAALVELIRAIGPLIERDDLRSNFIDLLRSLPSAALSRVWTEIYRLDAQFNRRKSTDCTAALNELIASLPEAGPTDRLRALARARPWDLGGHRDLQHELLTTARSVDPDHVEIALLDVLDEPVASAYDVGQTLAQVTREPLSSLAALVAQLGSPNEPALIGFLRKSVDDGDPTAFDKFLDGPLGQGLSPEVRLGLTVRGPGTPAAKARLRDLISSLPVRTSASQVFNWRDQLGDSEIAQFVQSWIQRLDSQDDYDAVIDLVALVEHAQDDQASDIDPLVGRLLQLRLQFPDIGRREWDWSELAKHQLGIDPTVVLQVLLQLASGDSTYAPLGQQDREVLQLAMAETQPHGWVDVMDAIEAGAWQLRLDGADWLGDCVPVDVVRNWVGLSSKRAEIVASVASLRGDTPTELVRFLLESFGGDQRVSSTLLGSLTSGSWVGSESSRIDGQIRQLENWVVSEPHNSSLRDWVAEATRSLRRQLETARLREAEYGD